MSEPKKKNNRFCPIARKCGACQLQNMSYPEQLSWKMAKSIKLLSRFGHVDEIIGMDEPYHYRNKAQAAFGRTARGRIISGIYQSGTHIIATTDSCYLESPEADAIIVTIRRLAESVGLPIYDEDRRVGCLRHVLVRTGAESGQILVAIVTATPVFPGKNHFIQALLAAHPQITTIVQNINSGHDSMVLGKTQKVLYGSGYIEDTLCGCVFRISARSFYQINHAQTEKLYDMLRIDHFRGLYEYWAVPADAETAKEGKWCKGPQKALFENLKKVAPDIEIIAEDLGIIDENVEKFLAETGFYGMRVMQFGFDGDKKNKHLPHNYDKNCVAYTATHDNDTTLGWLLSLDENTLESALNYVACDSGYGWADGAGKCRATRAFIRAVMASKANISIVPMQDLCGY